MTTETEDEKKIRLEKEAADLAAKAEKIEIKLEEGKWTPEQITNLMTQLSEIHTQQGKILERLEKLPATPPATPATPQPSNVEEGDPLEAQAKLEAQEKARQEQEAADKLKNQKPPKHRLL
jgi:hypothetical protein